MMRCLEVKTTVEEVEIGRARDIHGCSKLAMSVRFEELGVGNHGGGDGDGLRKVGENDLAVEESQHRERAGRQLVELT